MRVALKFFSRIFLTSLVAYGIAMSFFAILLPRGLPMVVVLTGLVAVLFFWVSATSHWRRVSLVASEMESASLSNRQIRQIELPVVVEEAFTLVEATLRAQPNLHSVESTRAGWQVRAKARAAELTNAPGRVRSVIQALDVERSVVLAIVSPRDGAASVKLICEPEGGPLADWFMFDRGSNLITADAIARALSQKIGEARRGERDARVAAATQKEVAEAKLSVLEAQVEPHFLYNTLGSAKYLIKSDPARAEAMLDNLIVYLRNSLPKTEESASTLGEELTRARAYLEIMQIRMGERLQQSIDVPEELEREPFPAMMLQTLVENAIKHGLEPKPAGGTVWIRARRETTGAGPALCITVADDGLGLNHAHSGTGIGHKNIRERLKLLFDSGADLTLTTNFPTGLAATIRLPTQEGSTP